MTYQLGQRSLANLQGVHPDLVKVMKAAIVNSPVDFTITEGLRTTKRQQELFAQGRTTPGVKVTNADGVKNLSNHQDEADGRKDGLGQAVDLYPFFEGKVQVNHKDTIARLKDIAAHIKKTAKDLGIKIVWGGDWKSPYDPPHFQLG
ncbi:M15 family metallopeptidase [Chryseobacterium sp. R2A-55]|uniref:M15 family metallopeptidase n=1 Tax=Chryseobacterium sp. R2A-55 TaxID=2744445 RepID=UPI001F18737D|nr:M15 family metallopeptidase [Chryseobacterium sp. R2A-55]